MAMSKITALVLVVIAIGSAVQTPLGRQAIADLSDYRIRGSYYVPGDETRGLWVGSPENVTIALGPLPHEIIIAQNQGRRISRVSKNGETSWSFNASIGATGMEIIGQILIASVGNIVVAFDIKSGKILGSYAFTYPLTGVGLVDDTIIALPVGSDIPPQQIKLTDLLQNSETPVALSLAETLTSPRHILRLGDNLAIADTFNHRVLIADKNSGDIIAQTEIFFPNQLMSGGENLLIAEEHGNRILIWDWQAGTREILVGCDFLLFSDPNTLPDAIRASETSSWNGGFFGYGAHSACDADVNRWAIYSPNGFTRADDKTIYIADTDNHRVLVLDGATGETIAEVTGLNNPVRVVVLEAE